MKAWGTGYWNAGPEESGDGEGSTTCMTDLVFQLLFVFVIGFGGAMGLPAFKADDTMTSGKSTPERGSHITASVYYLPGSELFEVKLSSRPTELLSDFKLPDSVRFTEKEVAELTGYLIGVRRELIDGGVGDVRFKVTYIPDREASYREAMKPYAVFHGMVGDSFDVYIAP